jgi:single-stranded-DNA-specific exonuclease
MALLDPKEALAHGVGQSLGGQSWYWRTHILGVAEAIAQHHATPEVVGRVLAGRGVSLEEAAQVLNPTLRDWLPDPSVFIDMDKAAKRLAHAVVAQQAIVIFGDYDVDGATSAALLLRVLRSLGARHTSAYIPDRLLEGYGPSAKALCALKEAGADLVVCVDCGTQAFEALAAAAQAGLEVIVVDHHKASIALPPAVALVNPNRFDESEEGARHGHLAAVGLAFILCVALVRALRQQGYFTPELPEPFLLQELDLVALGTVCDVVPLKGLNRALVAQGLKVMAKRANLGLKVLSDVAGIDEAPNTTSCGFHLGPRINAGGRVGRADLGVRLLTTTDTAQAQSLAAELNQLNSERRALEALALEEALALAEGANELMLVVVGAGWHPGVIGILASRLKERTGKPCFVITLYEGVGKGSGRSIPGVDLGAAVLAAQEAGLLMAGGGHAMAAGLTVAPENIPALRQFLNAHLEKAIASAMRTQGLLLDGSLTPSAVTPELVQALNGAGPYGSGFANPRFVVGPVKIIRADLVGQDHIRLFTQGLEGGRLKAVAFRAANTPMGAEFLAANNRRFWLAGRLVCDVWSGRAQAELHVEDGAIIA